jgi:type III restriction enzyme
MLKHSDNTISRRQEVGRGLRIAVNQHGERMDHPATVHDINVLTVVTSESYTDFVGNLQREFAAALGNRPREATTEYFTGKRIASADGVHTVTATEARAIEKYLTKNGYTDNADHITPAYHDAKRAGTLAPLPAELLQIADGVTQLIESVYSDAALPVIVDERRPKRNPLNANFHKREFRELWARINHKAVYSVDFDSRELVDKCIVVLNGQLRVTPLQYVVTTGAQADALTYEQASEGKGYTIHETRSVRETYSAGSQVTYDLIGSIADGTVLTRRTVVAILQGIETAVYANYKLNPEQFIAEACRLINEQKATVIVEHLRYNPLADTHDIDIFTAPQLNPEQITVSSRLQRHIYDYVATDSTIEATFARQLDTSDEVVVYAKLPRGFFIPTPIGDYNPDWAISFREGSVKHVFFVAETKGSMSSLQLRLIEDMKIACAKKFFTDISSLESGQHVKYDVVKNYEKLMEIVNT